MMTKTEVTKTYWVGMTTEQKKELLNAVNRMTTLDSQNFRTFNEGELEVLEALRLALLNT